MKKQYQIPAVQEVVFSEHSCLMTSPEGIPLPPDPLAPKRLYR